MQSISSFSDGSGNLEHIVVRHPRFFSSDLQLRVYNQKEALLWLAFRKMVEDAVIPASAVTRALFAFVSCRLIVFH